MTKKKPKKPKAAPARRPRAAEQVAPKTGLRWLVIHPETHGALFDLWGPKDEVAERAAKMVGCAQDWLELIPTSNTTRTLSELAALGGYAMHRDVYRGQLFGADAVAGDPKEPPLRERLADLERRASALEGQLAALQRRWGVIR